MCVCVSVRGVKGIKRTPAHANSTQKGSNKLIKKAHLKQCELEQSDVQ